MPSFDMNLEELKRYGGTNPAPHDFEDFWDKGLKEVDGIDPRPELVPADFKAPNTECFSLFFTSTLGARIHAKYLRPAKRQGKCPAVFGFHGYTGESGDWHEKLDYTGAGFCAALLDCRGQAGKSEDPGGVKGHTAHGLLTRGLDGDPERMTFRNIILDTYQLTRVVMALPEVDAERLGALGTSQGGGLTLACAALQPKIKKIAPQYPWLCDYQRSYNLRDGEEREYMRRFDPEHKRVREIFTKLGYIDVQHLARRIKAETLLGVGLQDNLVPPSTQFAAFNKIRSKKELALYPDFGHEWLPGFWDKAFALMMEL